MRPDNALPGLAWAPSAPAPADNALPVTVVPAAPLISSEATPPRRLSGAADIIAGHGHAHGRDSNTPGGGRPAARAQPRDSPRAKDDDQDDGGTADSFAGSIEVRMDYLSLAATTATPLLRMNRAGREPALTAARPSSRIECMRRCASDGFCDPSDDSCCGGEYCLIGGDRV